MKRFLGLFRPDWEHPDPARRAAAAAGSDDPALLARLPELAQADPDPGVRIAALRRLDDLVLLERRLRGERDEAVAAAARDRLRSLLAGPQPAAGAESCIRQLLDEPLLIELARSAARAELRRAALERLDRAALWAERCLHDPDPALRLWALERVDEAASLQRIAEGARRRDKRLARSARERIEAMALAAGDPEALRRRALAIAEELGLLARQLPADRNTRLDALRKAWEPLRPRVDADLQRRVDGARAMAEVALAAADDAGRAEPAAAPPPPPQPAPEPAAAEAEAFARDLLADLPAPEQADAEAVLAALSNRLEAQADALPEAERRRLRRRLADHAARVARHRAKTLDQAWTEARERLLAALEAGHPGPAREALQRCAELAGDEARQRALNAWRARLAELERWQHWADRQARARLCEQAAALHGSGLHPDALATRIRELQEAWEQLDAVDGKAAPGLERRFRAHCARALAPARPYFEKRDALRQQHAAEVEALVERSAELPEEAGALRTLRGELVAALRELHRLPPGQRRRFGQALRERLDAVEQAIRAAQEAAALAKRRRLARLRRELGASAPELRLALARKAQAEWQTLPRADRATEQELRTELAQLLDPLFAGEQARRRQHDARQAEAEAAATAILDELSALAAAPPERLLQARAQLEQFEARWRALVPTPDPAPRSDRRGRPRRPHPLESRYREARDAAEAALALALQQQQKASIHALLEAGALLDALDAALDAERAPLRDRLQTLPLHPEDRAALEPRLASGAVSALEAEQAERLVVEAELLAGVDSPSGSAALRRTLQMQRLARRLEGEPEAPPGEALRSLLRQLQASPLADPAQRQALLQRWQLAWEAIAR